MSGCGGGSPGGWFSSDLYRRELQKIKEAYAALLKAKICCCEDNDKMRLEISKKDELIKHLFDQLNKSEGV
jgi:hypothetical protein